VPTTTKVVCSNPAHEEVYPIQLYVIAFVHPETPILARVKIYDFIILYFVLRLWIMLFNTAFNNISAISWWSDLLMGKTEYPAKTIVLPQVNDHLYIQIENKVDDRRGRDRMIVGFTTTCADKCLLPLKLCVRIPLMRRCTRIVLYNNMFLFWTGISTYGNKSMKNKTHCLISFKFY
jgi:hypothetical protein